MSSGKSKNADQALIEELKNAIERCLPQRFIRKKDIKDAKDKLLSNEITLDILDDEDKDIFKFIQLDLKDVIQLIKNSNNNFIYLLNKKNKITIDNLEIILKEVKECSNEVFKIIIDSRLLSIEQIIELFLEGIISEENIQQIKEENILEEIINYIRLKIVTICNEILANKDAKENKNLIKNIINYGKLYRLLQIKGRKPEEIEANTNKLINLFGDYLESEHLQLLYQYSIISIDIALSWGVNIKDLLSKNIIKPQDLKNCYSSKKVSIEQIKEVIRGGLISFKDGINLVYSTFFEKEYEDIRQQLFMCFPIQQSSRNRGTRRGSKKPPKGNNNNSTPGGQLTPQIVSTFNRWQVFSILDSEYSNISLPKGYEIKDGHNVYFFPNSGKSGKVVIEKFFDRGSNGKIVESNKKATYILEAEDFYNNLEKIVLEDGTINRRFLTLLYKGGNADRFIHNHSWRRVLLNYFGKEEPEKTKYYIPTLADADVLRG